MFPMVASAYEFRAARNLLLAEARRVRPAPERLSIGTMIEVPSLIWQLPALLEEADFISVGTNDLMQFFFAADRSSPALAGRYDLLSAPALDMLEYIRVQADRAGKPVSVCGEAASRPLEAMVLAALGYRILSMPAGSLLPIKALLAETDIGALAAVLATLRQGGAWDASLREPLALWAREHELDV
jgi:phosphotransferase system enzyme I (PtsP)